MLVLVIPSQNQPRTYIETSCIKQVSGCFPCPACSRHCGAIRLDGLCFNPASPAFLGYIVGYILAHIVARGIASAGGGGPPVGLVLGIDLLDDHAEGFFQVVALFHRKESTASIKGRVP